MPFSDRKIIKNVIIHKGPAQIFPTNEVMNILHYYLKTKEKKFPCRKTYKEMVET